MTTSSFERSEPLSPELVLVDPELRRRFLAQQPQAAKTPRSYSPPATRAPQVLRLAAPTRRAPAPTNDVPTERRASPKVPSLFVAATAAAAALGMILAQALSSDPGLPAPGATTAQKSGVLTPPTQTVAVVPSSTPPTTPVKRLSPDEKHRLASLLRLPMRDPFARPTG